MSHRHQIVYSRASGEDRILLLDNAGGARMWDFIIESPHRDDNHVQMFVRYGTQDLVLLAPAAAEMGYRVTAVQCDHHEANPLVEVIEQRVIDAINSDPRSAVDAIVESGFFPASITFTRGADVTTVTRDGGYISDSDELFHTVIVPRWERQHLAVPTTRARARWFRRRGRRVA